MELVVSQLPMCLRQDVKYCSKFLQRSALTYRSYTHTHTHTQSQAIWTHVQFLFLAAVRSVTCTAPATSMLMEPNLRALLFVSNFGKQHCEHRSDIKQETFHGAFQTKCLNGSVFLWPDLYTSGAKWCIFRKCL